MYEGTQNDACKFQCPSKMTPTSSLYIKHLEEIERMVPVYIYIYIYI